jgi:hypothetical protein
MVIYELQLGSKSRLFTSYEAAKQYFDLTKRVFEDAGVSLIGFIREIQVSEDGEALFYTDHN